MSVLPKPDQKQSEQGVNWKLSKDLILDTLLPPQLCFNLLIFLLSSVLRERERPQRNKFSFVGEKDYFHNSRTLPQM